MYEMVLRLSEHENVAHPERQFASKWDCVDRAHNVLDE
jgi:hypothetical protein